MRVNLVAVVLLSSSMMVFAAPASADPPESGVHMSDAYPVQGSNVAPKRARHARSSHKARRSPHRHSVRHATRERAHARSHRSAMRHLRGHHAISTAKELHQGHNPRDAFASFGSNSLVSEARRWIGTNPTGRASLWCARFMNFVLKRVGLKGTSSDMARSFASYGRRVPGPRVGAIAVMSCGRNGGHVGVVSGIDAKGNPIIISGNYGRRVAEAKYPRGRIYAYVMP